jgi:hypothetical protein
MRDAPNECNCNYAAYRGHVKSQTSVPIDFSLYEADTRFIFGMSDRAKLALGRIRLTLTTESP